MPKFVIDRSKWLRGEGAGELLREADGKQCCVGIYLSACGVAADELASVSAAEDVQLEALPGGAEWLVHRLKGIVRDAEATNRLYAANDSKKTSEVFRETEIAEYFKEKGVEVEFVG